ncbi:MAG: hypothetical protein AAF327_26045 [Cyanobacteria bacterium P01_A01_bin.37]
MHIILPNQNIETPNSLGVQSRAGLALPGADRRVRCDAQAAFASEFKLDLRPLDRDVASPQDLEA